LRPQGTKSDKAIVTPPNLAGGRHVSNQSGMPCPPDG